MMSLLRLLGPLALLAACATAPGRPANAPDPDPPAAPLPADILGPDQETLIGLAVSGGGIRAAAFSHGVLAELADTPVPGRTGVSMADRVGFVSAVSGGSLTAAWFGLHGPEGIARFPEALLHRAADEDLTIDDSLASVAKGLSGGVNEAHRFRDWLAREVVGDARMGDLAAGRARIFINATDLLSRVPFVFSRDMFAPLCSDVAAFPVADAIAASAAVPVVFRPTVLESHASACDYAPPPWVQRAARDPSAPAAMRAIAAAIARYRDPERLRYVKLVDGGVSDNIGVTALMLARVREGTPHAPLTARDAVRVRRILYLVVNAGQEPEAPWAHSLDGPEGFELILAPVYAAIDSSIRNGYDSFRRFLAGWTEDLIRYRCALPEAEVALLRGGLEGWNCRDLKIFLGEVRFDRLPAEMRAALQEVPTALSLPRAQVELTVEAGRQALLLTPAYRGALRSIAGPRRGPS